MAEAAPFEGARRKEAEESVAAHFSRVMNATTSRYGVLTDPPIVAIATGPLVIALLAAMRLSASPSAIQVLEVLAALPLLLAVAVSLLLRAARGRVVDWLAGLPFPVENMNTVLNGLGEGLEIIFADAYPKAPELNAELDKVCPDAFVTSSPDTAETRSERGAAGAAGVGDAKLGRAIEIRIGVVDSKWNPAASNYLRFERVRALVGSVLVPLHERFPIAEARIK